MAQPYFAAEEYGARLAALRVGTAARGIELTLLSAPENIFYLTGLRADSDIPVRIGMSFHTLSWLMGTGRGDYFISNTVLLGEEGPEVLPRTPMQVTAR